MRAYMVRRELRGYSMTQIVGALRELKEYNGIPVNEVGAKLAALYPILQGGHGQLRITEKDLELALKPPAPPTPPEAPKVESPAPKAEAKPEKKERKARKAKEEPKKEEKPSRRRNKVLEAITALADEEDPEVTALLGEE